MNEPAGAACHLDDRGCITCGDVAVPLRVTEVLDAGDARCVDEHGHAEVVATELVGAVVAGEVLLVHAGVALERLDAAAHGEGS